MHQKFSDAPCAEESRASMKCEDETLISHLSRLNSVCSWNLNTASYILSTEHTSLPEKISGYSGLSDNSYDKSMCQKQFDLYKACKKVEVLHLSRNFLLALDEAIFQLLYAIINARSFASINPNARFLCLDPG